MGCNGAIGEVRHERCGADGREVATGSSRGDEPEDHTAAANVIFTVLQTTITDQNEVPKLGCYLHFGCSMNSRTGFQAGFMIILGEARRRILGGR